MYVYTERTRYKLVDIRRIGDSDYYRVACENKNGAVVYAIAELQICRGKLRVLPIINDISRRTK